MSSSWLRGPARFRLGLVGLLAVAAILLASCSSEVSPEARNDAATSDTDEPAGSAEVAGTVAAEVGGAGMGPLDILSTVGPLVYDVYKYFDKGTSLSTVESQLKDIDNILKNIQAELGDLEDEVTQLLQETELSTLNDAYTGVMDQDTGVWAEYQTYIGSKVSGSTDSITNSDVQGFLDKIGSSTSKVELSGNIQTWWKSLGEMSQTDPNSKGPQEIITLAQKASSKNQAFSDSDYYTMLWGTYASYSGARVKLLYIMNEVYIPQIAYAIALAKNGVALPSGDEVDPAMTASPDSTGDGWFISGVPKAYPTWDEIVSNESTWSDYLDDVSTTDIADCLKSSQDYGSTLCFTLAEAIVNFYNQYWLDAFNLGTSLTTCGYTATPYQVDNNTNTKAAQLLFTRPGKLGSHDCSSDTDATQTWSPGFTKGGAFPSSSDLSDHYELKFPALAISSSWQKDLAAETLTDDNQWALATADNWNDLASFAKSVSPNPIKDDSDHEHLHHIVNNLTGSALEPKAEVSDYSSTYSKDQMTNGFLIAGDAGGYFGSDEAFQETWQSHSHYWMMPLDCSGNGCLYNLGGESGEGYFWRYQVMALGGKPSPPKSPRDAWSFSGAATIADRSLLWCAGLVPVSGDDDETLPPEQDGQQSLCAVPNYGGGDAYVEFPGNTDSQSAVVQAVMWPVSDLSSGTNALDQPCVSAGTLWATPCSSDWIESVFKDRLPSTSSSFSLSITDYCQGVNGPASGWSKDQWQTATTSSAWCRTFASS